MSFRLIILGLILASLSCALEWRPLICPASDHALNASCSEPAHTSDAVVTIFFQIESPVAASFSCADDAGLVLCARAWTNASESGAAGSCFFLLPKGVGYTCGAPSGSVNIIDADFSELAVEALRRWLRRRDSTPANVLALAKQFPKAEPALLQALRILT